MDKLKLRAKHILLPFLIVTISTSLFFIVLNLILKRFEYFELASYIPYIILFFGWVPYRLWISPRMNILDSSFAIDKYRFNGFRIFILVLSYLIFLFFFFSTLYFVETATQEITHLNSIDEIRTNNKSYFYTLDNYYLDKNNLQQVYVRGNPEGRYGDNEHKFESFIVIPILTKGKKISEQKCIAWYGVLDEVTISHYDFKNSNELMEKFEMQFLKNCKNKFLEKDSSKFYYLQKAGTGSSTRAANFFFLKHFESAVKFSKINKDDNPIVLIPSFTKMEDSQRFWIFYSAIILFVGTLLFFMTILYPKLK